MNFEATRLRGLILTTGSVLLGGWGVLTQGDILSAVDQGYEAGMAEYGRYIELYGKFWTDFLVSSAKDIATVGFIYGLKYVVERFNQKLDNLIDENLVNIFLTMTLIEGLEATGIFTTLFSRLYEYRPTFSFADLAIFGLPLLLELRRESEKVRHSR